MEEIQAKSQAVLNKLRENDFQECFKNWQCHWDCCQASEGDYFEGDAGPCEPFCVLSHHSGNLMTTPRK